MAQKGELRFSPWPLLSFKLPPLPPDYKPEHGNWLNYVRPGNCLGRGFVSDSRFGSGDVIKRTNRNVSRKWRKVQNAG